MSWPVPIPKWFWVWARWRLGHGEYKPFGPANPSVRPANAPKRIPKWAWERIRLIAKVSSPTPPSYTGLFSRFGTWTRNPRGGVEGVAEAVEYGVEWIGLNMHKGDWVPDPGPDPWGTVTRRAFANGIPVFPWKRCYSVVDVIDLMELARHAPAVGFNLEKELDYNQITPQRVVDVVNGYDYKGEVCILTEAWLYNSVRWDVFGDAGYVVALEMFPRDSVDAADPMSCVAHAKAMGVEKVHIMWDGRDAPHPARPNESVWVFDDAAGNWWPRG